MKTGVNSVLWGGHRLERCFCGCVPGRLRRDRAFGHPPDERAPRTWTVGGTGRPDQGAGRTAMGWSCWPWSNRARTQK